MQSISILIPTHNRAAIVEETLETMLRVDRAGMNVEWVVINNASTDRTDDVLRSYCGRLPLRILHEARPGKNRALNRGLHDAPLGDIVVFTDDDIAPTINWLEEIVAACDRWPQHDVFGGRILPRWPNGTRPHWDYPSAAFAGFCVA